MKKTAAKNAAAKTAAPAPAAPAKKAAAPKKAAAAKAPDVPAAAPVAKTPKAPKASAAPAVKAPKTSPAPKARPAAVTTTIVAAVDVGFGNHLTLRGEGPGLSWEAGVPLECIADDRWSITLPESAVPVVCKFLLNDTTWCAGPDYSVLPGSTVVLSPTF
jgi:hypothetical protein